MHEEVYNDFSNGDFTPHIPAAKGWQDMEWLLNTHLPAQARKGAWLIFTGQAAAVAAILLLLAIPLRDSFLTDHFLAHTHTQHIQVTPSRPIQYAAGGENSQSRRSPELPAVPATVAGAVALPTGNREWATALRKASPILLPVSPDTSMAGAARNTIVKQQSLKKWQLLAGLGVNAVTPADKQYLVPYPVVEARYFINKRLYVAAGLAIGSPVATSEKILEKTVTYDQPVNEMKLYREMRLLKRAVYTDVPVTAGLMLSKHLSVATGAQFSFLHKIVANRYSEAYDESMRQVNMFIGPMQVAPNAVVDEEKPIINIPKQDVRGLIAITWQAEKWHFTGQYQHSFGKGQRNLFLLKVQYQLK